ncbi:hypothetical protein M422DRAFT_259291 [Sphaerobolus stellatus SS14]|uniref:Uncharacterized protein n=1 Tax=Sphaerobolus stellatus (strain SS14) TaxID=990650 RepID=A0A0C9UTC5_SPHS4|nr:hypothetical protein M422DRAFT_259291 [Sphaerobolus stellatus SS14]
MVELAGTNALVSVEAIAYLLILRILSVPFVGRQACSTKPIGVAGPESNGVKELHDKPVEVQGGGASTVVKAGHLLLDSFFEFDDMVVFGHFHCCELAHDEFFIDVEFICTFLIKEEDGCFCGIETEGPIGNTLDLFGGLS